MKALLKLLICFLLSLGEANEEPLPAEEWTYESNGEVITLNDPEAIAKLQLSEVMRASNGTNLTLTAWSDRFDLVKPIKLYVGEGCCNLSTTSICNKRGGNCIPNNETCYGEQHFGEKYCVISNLKSCKCCVPAECEKFTFDPCKALNGTCIRVDKECDGRSVSGKQFCKDPMTCKCCFPKEKLEEDCPCGQDYDGGCSGYSRQSSREQSGQLYTRGNCMKTCEWGTFPLKDHTCNQTGSESCNCCAPINECFNKTGPNVTFLEMGGEYFYIHTEEWLNVEKAKAACEADGMRLAEPQEPQVFGLQAYFLNNKMHNHYWLGGQGNNVAMVWDSSGCEVYPDSTAVWETNHPGIGITTSFCLDLRTTALPGPLASYGCNGRHNFICECGQVESNCTTTTIPTTVPTTTMPPTTTPPPCGPQVEYNCNHTNIQEIGMNTTSSTSSHVFTSGMTLGIRFAPELGPHDLRIRVEAPGYNDSEVFAIRLDEWICDTQGCNWLFQYWTHTFQPNHLWSGIKLDCVPKDKWLLLTITDQYNGYVDATLLGFGNLHIPVSLPSKGVTIRVEAVPANFHAEISFDCPLPR